MEPVAIIGIGCRFPGAENPEEFWQLLRDGVDAIAEVPPDRWDIDAFYDPNPSTPGKMNTRWGGFLQQVDQFDPQFFGIAPREAMYMDPQQRLLLEVAWEAIEHAGQVPEQLARSSTGVFIGISSNDYPQLLHGGPDAINAYMGTGNAFSIVANRLSYLFDFRGPSLAIDTACSSSLVAVHLACQSLRTGESNLALAGGVNLLLRPELTIIFSKAQMMAPDGRCKTFDASANGYVRGEGCGIVVLKRLTEAIRDNDRILALIRGSATNQDGRSNGLTAPNGPAQEAVISQALAIAGVASSQISYIELHGTGTSLGDPIEAAALGAVLSADRSPENRCAVGSAKTNIGHLEAAAGIAGLIKVALSLQQGQIPPSLHFRTPNPYIPLEQLPLQVQQSLGPWPDRAESALAGVSSFGFGGTNAHVILEAAPQGPKIPRPDHELTPHSAYLLPLSARSPEALTSLVHAYQKFLTPTAAGAAVSLRDLCYTASVRRSHHDHRLSLVFHSHAELITLLEAFQQGEFSPALSAGHRHRNCHKKLVFIFSGQGSQWWAMGRELWQQEPVFRAALEQCDALLCAHAGWSLVKELLADESQSCLAETNVAQPALFALQVALVDLWRSWGVTPSAVVGHSLGEVAAAHVAGVLSLEEAVRVVFHRGRAMQQATGQGKMAAVELSLPEAESLLAGYTGRLAIAAINSPTSLVLSGDATALEEVLQLLQNRQIFVRSLPVNYAFHSPQMEAFQSELVQSLAGLNPKPASMRIISTVTGQDGLGQDFNAHYWGRNIREPVRFADAIGQLVQAQHTLFLEISPHPVLAVNLAQCLRHLGQEGTVLPSLRRQTEERAVILGSLGTLYTLGYPVAWNHLYPSEGRCVTLPSYPWQRSRYWVDISENQPVEQPRPSAPRPTSHQGTSPPTKASLLPNPNGHKVKLRLTRAELLAIAPSDRPQHLEAYFRDLLATVMGLSGPNLDRQQLLLDLGLDSLMAIELRSQIEADLKVVVPWESLPGLNVTGFVKLVSDQLAATVPAPSVPHSMHPPVPPGRLKMNLPRPPAIPKAIGGSNSSRDDLWVTRPRRTPQAQIRLFCFPYAGAGASIFRSWTDALAPEIEVCPIQLPGRENRREEAPLTRLSPLVQALARLLPTYLDIPFAFFGHSMGALIGFELARELRRQKQPSPVHLFVSASRAPQTPNLDLPIHRLPDLEFIEKLRSFNGIPAKVLQTPDLLQLWLPALRADFALIETYIYASEEALNCPIFGFGGLQDSKVSYEDLTAWRVQTQKKAQLQFFPGDHFFLHSDRGSLLQAISQHLKKTVSLK
jgi:acyl transferase domain-containing protein/surfactin synthase thioesterase subunit